MVQRGIRATFDRIFGRSPLSLALMAFPAPDVITFQPWDAYVIVEAVDSVWERRS